MSDTHSAGNGTSLAVARLDPATIMFHVGDAVTKLLDLRGWTQSDLATAAGVRPNTISDFVRQKSRPEPETLARILAALEVTPAELATLVDKMNGETPATAARPLSRAEDHDPRLKDAHECGLRIAMLPEIAQFAIYHLIRAFESTSRDRPGPKR